MATYLPGSGALSISSINSVFGRGNNLNAYRGTTYYTSSAGPYTFSSGAISMSSFYGTGPSPNTFSFSITSNQANADLRTLAVNAGWNQSSPVVATVSSGVYIYSTSTGSAALTISGSWPGGVTLINNGYIMGQGGEGGWGYNQARSATAGGPAISLGVSVTIASTSGYIAGGGGGGGANTGGGGGGAGGGRGGNGFYSSASVSSTGGAGGSIGGSGSSGSYVGSASLAGGGGGAGGGGSATANKSSGAGGGGGRILPGSGGAAGTGTANGGAGGSANNGGTSTSGAGGSGGGGWGATGGSSSNSYGTGAGAAGGKAVALNGYSVSWSGGFPSSVYGAVS